MGRRDRTSAGLAFLDQLLVRVVLARASRTSGQGRATGILRAFALAERLLERWYTPYPIRTGGVLRYEVGRLPLGTRPLPLDPPVRPRDPIVRLHLDNHVLVALMQSGASLQEVLVEISRIAQQDLTALAAMAQAGTFPLGTRALWAETVTYRAMAWLGFETRAAKSSVRLPFARLYALALLLIYGSPRLGSRGLDRLQQYRLGEAWMDVRDLVHRYGREAR